MKALTLLLIPAALLAAQARFARLGEFNGKVEVQLNAADAWIAAERNLPLPESAWLRTGPASRLEIELDEGSALRLGPDSLAEISDYARLSTGQRVTLLSVDRGLAYFTGQPGGNDSLSIAVPGAHLIFTRGARIRIEALADSSNVSVIEGSVRVSSREWETEAQEGNTIRIELAGFSNFSLMREVPALPLDEWSENRDKALDSPASGAHVAQRFGVADLDGAGEWVETAAGLLWKPQQRLNWTPFQSGRWRWYDALGYAWVSNEPWGWLPYHYGRWRLDEKLGWLWNPGKVDAFMPGDVYWLQGSKMAGWGPLAPGEDWKPPAAPLQFMAASTTFGAFQQDARAIESAPLSSRAAEALKELAFVTALPSPAFAASRLQAVRPVLRAGSTRVVPMIDGVTYDDSPQPATVALPGPGMNTGAGDAAVMEPPPAAYPPPQPVDVIYTAPPEIVIVNPPDHPDRGRRPRPVRPDPPAPPRPNPEPTEILPRAGGSGRQEPVVHRPPVIAPAPPRPNPEPTEILPRAGGSGRQEPVVHRPPVSAPTPAAPVASPAPAPAPARRSEPAPAPSRPSAPPPAPAPAPSPRSEPAPARPSTPAPAPAAKPEPAPKTDSEQDKDKPASRPANVASPRGR
jgi:hypothetical protein